jgi:pimeloyl-ACP methyl ester carboxylesterase
MRSVLRGFAALVLCTSCALYTRATVGVSTIGSYATQGKLNENAILGTEPSTFAREALHALNLDELFDTDPDAALRVLHRAALEDKDRRQLYALAELSYSVGRRLGSRSHFLAAAVYAYCYLFDDQATDPPNAFDRRYRWACDLYNRGLQFALVPSDLGYLDMASVPHGLPVGSIDITLDRSHFPWREELFPRFLPVDDFDVFGLSLRYRRAGLGVPLIGAAPEKGASTASADPADKFLGKRTCVPATAFLRFEGGIAAIERGISAKLELYSGYDVQETKVGGSPVPLESDLSTPLAYALGKNTALWDFSLTGFFGGKSEFSDNRLVMVRPYERGRIPVVFVHGTASNPAYWAEMYNTLQADPVLRDSIQCWFFVYKTGYPIAYSAATLRESLRDAIDSLDPEGKDPALHHMVVIGHSQGGILTRMMVTDGDISWLKDMYGTPFEDFHLTPDQQKLVRRGLDFDPVPEVDRVVFICTPHRGSSLAVGFLARLASGLISLPREFLEFNPKLAESQKGVPEELRIKRIGTSLDNMGPDNPLLKRLAQAPIAPGVTAHSIIARDGGDSLEESDDGLVAYKSSHLEAAASEFVVESGHSCQSNPLTIREVRRILIEHLRSIAYRGEQHSSGPRN